MAEEDSIAAQAFAAWGATAQRQPTSSKEETDWLVELDGFRLLVEEKDKLENPAHTQARADDLRAGRVHGTSVPVGPSNRISGVIRKATRQLHSTGATVQHDARIIWITAVGFDAEAKHLQFMATLYGSTSIFELDKPQMKECYFFRNSDFYRYRDFLDGAVAAKLQGDTLTMNLCLNPYGLKWRALGDSPFAKQFKTGLVDPIAQEKAGKAYIADTDLPRTNLIAVIKYLETKYGLTRIMNMDMNVATAVVAIPRDR